MQRPGVWHCSNDQMYNPSAQLADNCGTSAKFGNDVIFYSIDRGGGAFYTRSFS